jgi:hypothetical protein
MAILTGLKWNLSALLICISFTMKGVVSQHTLYSVFSPLPQCLAQVSPSLRPIYAKAINLLYEIQQISCSVSASILYYELPF